MFRDWKLPESQVLSHSIRDLILSLLTRSHLFVRWGMSPRHFFLFSAKHSMNLMQCTGSVNIHEKRTMSIKTSKLNTANICYLCMLHPAVKIIVLPWSWFIFYV